MEFLSYHPIALRQITPSSLPTFSKATRILSNSLKEWAQAAERNSPGGESPDSFCVRVRAFDERFDASIIGDRYGPQDRRHQIGGAGKATSGLKECQQVGVELFFVRVREAVRRARVDL